MDINLKQLLESFDKELFNEDLTSKITTLFESTLKEEVQRKVNERVELAVETALTEQSKDFAQKFNHAIEALKTSIDKDHTAKIKFIVENLHKDCIEKMLALKEAYETKGMKTIAEHKDRMVDAIEIWLEKFSATAVPQEQIVEAARNNHAKFLLDEARKVLAVDPSIIKKEIREGVLESRNIVNRLTAENAQLKKEKEKEQTKKLLIEKTQNLPKEVKQFVMTHLQNKPYAHIKENIDYVIELYGLNEKRKKNSASLEAPKPNQVERTSVVVEAANQISESGPATMSPLMNDYLNIMSNRNLAKI